MKLTTRNLLIILVVLGAAYGVSQLTKRSGRSKSLRTELVAIDTVKVSKIELKDRLASRNKSKLPRQKVSLQLLIDENA